MTRVLLTLLLLGCAVRSGLALRGRQQNKVTPVEQVITLMEDLIAQTKEEGSAEATTYDEFSCFCKDTTKEKSDAIGKDKDEIDSQSATLEEKTTLKNDLEKQISDLQALIAQIDVDMSDAQKKRDEENTQYEATSADLAAAVTGINKAMESVESSAPASFEQLKASVRKSLVIADVLDVSPKHQRMMNALLQEQEEGDEGAPESDFESHTGDLQALMGDLAKRYEDKKAACEAEEAKAVKAHNSYMASKTGQRDTAESDLSARTADLGDCKKAIGEAEEALADAQAMLNDDETYLKDLTAKCELKAREWDQRSAMRGDELTALNAALGVMTDRVKVADEGANKRALLQKDNSYIAPEPAAKKVQKEEDVDEDDVGDVSFLQKKSPVGDLLKRAQARHAAKEAEEREEEEKAMEKTQKQSAPRHGTDSVLELLREKSLKLKSPILSTLAMKIAADPFAKVKKLIQELIERMVTEAADEATQKGFCDTELGKARSSRDTEHVKVNKINANVESLEATRDKLSDEIATLASELAELNSALTTTTELRGKEKEENMDTLTKANEGLDAVTEAIGILADFYKGAAKGAVSLLQVSPVDEAAGSQGTADGAYQGNQAASGGIMGMMNVIKSDFERTIETTKNSEYEAARAFAEFDTTTKSSIAAKETAKGMKESDKTTTEADITQGMADLKEHMTLLDDSMKQLEDLNPQCIDTGMSYDERVAKREEEIEALKTALDQLS